MGPGGKRIKEKMGKNTKGTWGHAFTLLMLTKEAKLVGLRTTIGFMAA